jgi:hypothetical protein
MGAKGGPPVAIFPNWVSFPFVIPTDLNFFLSFGQVLAYDTIPEETYLSG